MKYININIQESCNIVSNVKELKDVELEKVSGGESEAPKARFDVDQTVYYWWENGSFIQIYGVIRSANYDQFAGEWKYLIHHDEVRLVNSVGIPIVIDAEDEYIYEEYISYQFEITTYIVLILD